MRTALKWSWCWSSHWKVWWTRSTSFENTPCCSGSLGWRDGGNI